MKRIFATTAILLVLAASASVFAGGKKCNADTQACVNKMAETRKTKAWLGVETESLGKEYFSKIINVVANSPAEAAGFQKGDILVAINGVVLKKENLAELKKAKKTLAAGSQASYLVKRDGSKVKLTATLAPMPEEVFAARLGRHILKNHVAGVEIAAN